jgi:hypothetical protein
MQGALERAICELVLGHELDLSDPKVMSDWLARHEVSTQDAAALRSADLQRLLVYRRLVQGTLRSTVDLAMPRAIARMGSLFDEYFSRFLAERGPQTHYLRDVTYELLAWSAPLFAKDERVADYLPDLMRHEALRIEMGALPGAEKPQPLGELQLEQPVVFIEASRVVRYDFAVHELLDDIDDRTLPRPGVVTLFVYRSPEHDVRYLELSALAAAILDGLHTRQETLRQAMTAACARLDCALTQEVLTGAARLLADLAERGVLRGALQGSGISRPAGNA